MHRSKITAWLPYLPALLALAVASTPAAQAAAQDDTVDSLIRGPDVAAIGEKLRALGYYAGPVTVQVTPELGDAIARYFRDTRLAAEAHAQPASPRSATSQSGGAGR